MPDAPRSVPPEVIEALKRGDKATAIKTLLQGGQVKSLKDVMRLLEQLQASGALKAANVSVATRTATLPTEVAAALHSGNKIEAIRLLREATGIGLAEAKAAVEAHERGHGMLPTAAGAPAHAPPHAKHAASAPVQSAPSAPMQTNGLSPGEVPRTSGTSIGFVVLLIVAAIVVWIVLRSS